MENKEVRYIFNKDAFALYRKNLGLSRRSMAELIEIKERTIKAWETGEGVPSTKTIKSVSDSLRIKPEIIAIKMDECIQSLKSINNEKANTFELVNVLEEKVNEAIEAVNDEMTANLEITILNEALMEIDNDEINELINNPFFNRYSKLIAAHTKEQVFTKLRDLL